jgi:hypothetical protein
MTTETTTAPPTCPECGADLLLWAWPDDFVCTDCPLPIRPTADAAAPTGKAVR